MSAAPAPAEISASFLDRIKAATSGGTPQPGLEQPEETPPDEPEAEPEAEEAPAADAPAEGAEPAQGDPEPDASDLTTLTYPVTVDGEVKELPLAELAKGYLQERDYTQKTQALADERRAFQGERTSWATQRQQVAQQLDLLVPVLIDRMQAGRANPQRLAELKQSDPGEYARLVLDQQAEENVLRQAASQRMALIQQEQAEATAALEASKPAARVKLMTTIPAFRETDREKSVDGFNYAQYDAVTAYVRSKGFSQEEAAITDPRMVEIAYWAMQAEHAAKTVKKAQPQLGQLSKPIRPGARKLAPTSRETEAREVRALTAKAKQTGSTRDVAAAIARMGLHR